MVVPFQIPNLPANGQHQQRIPESLIRPPGVLADMIDWINDTAPRRQPMLAYANAIAWFGAVIGRRVESETGLRTNIYCIGVAGSGAGKDHSRTCIKKLAMECGQLHLLGGEDVTSDAAILSAARRSPSILFQIDEVGHFINQAMNPRAASHSKTIPTTFTRLFSAAQSVHQGKEYANSERQDIIEPNVCLYGTTVASRLWEGITSSEIEDGFIPRMLVFNGAKRPQKRRIRPYPPPAPLVEELKAWSSPIAGAGNIESLQSSQVQPKVACVKSSVEAEKLAREAEQRWDGEAEKGDSGAGAIWSRAGEHATKLALIYACSRDRHDLQIKAKDMRPAVALVDHLIRSIIKEISANVSSSQYERDVQKVYLAIRDRSGITQTELSRATKSLTKKVREDAIRHLMEQERIAFWNDETGGRPVNRYGAID